MPTVLERVQNVLVRSLSYFFKKDDLTSNPQKEIKGISQSKILERLQNADKNYKEAEVARLVGTPEVVVEVKAEKKLIIEAPEVTVAENPKPPTQELGGGYS